MKSKFIFSVLFLCFSFFAAAQTYTVTSSGDGDWDVPGTWTWIGTPSPSGMPECGDIIHILSGDEITICGQENYDVAGCNDYMYLMIEGTLNFACAGPKLRFPCNGSIIEVGVGGSVIRTGNGGGQNNYIDICGVTVWIGTDPDIVDPIILTGTEPLPIELLSFDLKQENQSCLVTWVTGSEVNNDFFTVERSRDLSFWEVIAYVGGSGNSSHAIQYSHVDAHPWPGTSYYRLRQTDFDGAYETFDIQSLQFMEDTEVMLYPNPADEQMVISGDDVERVDFRDALGKIHSISPSNSSDSKHRYDVSGLPDGVYHLEISGKTQTQSETIFILH